MLKAEKSSTEKKETKEVLEKKETKEVQVITSHVHLARGPITE